MSQHLAMVKTMHKTTGMLHPALPFDFAKSIQFIGGFAPARGEQEAGAETLSKVFAIDGAAVLARVRAGGDDQHPQLAYELVAAEQLADRRIAMEQRLTMYLSLDDDLRPLYALAGDDPPFWRVVERLHGYHQVKFASPWEAAAWAVLSQRTPIPVAQRAKQRLTERFGLPIEFEGQIKSAFPEPAAMADADLAELGELAGGERKAGYLLAVARAFTAVDEAWLVAAPYDEVEGWLRAIEGIGTWSAEFVLLRGLGRMERLPAEKRLLEAASRVYDRAVDERELERLAERYGPHRGYWAHYLRVAG